MKSFFLLLITGLLTGGVFVAGKLVRIDEISALSILVWQVSGACMILWVAVLIARKNLQWSAPHIRYYLVGGLFGVSLPFGLIYTVLEEISVGLVGLITALSPMVTYAIARLLGSEPGSKLRLIGILAGLFGVVLIMVPRDTAASVEQWPYLLLALGIPVSLAMSNIYRSHEWPAGGEALPLATGMLTLQGFILIPVAALFGQLQLPVLVNTSTAPVVVALMLMAGLSYLGTFALLRIRGAVYLSQLGYVITVVTVGAGYLFMDEHYNQSDWVAMGIIFCGLLLVSQQAHELRSG